MLFALKMLILAHTPMPTYLTNSQISPKKIKTKQLLEQTWLQKSYRCGIQDLSNDANLSNIMLTFIVVTNLLCYNCSLFVILVCAV